ncbi:PhzF family phenazine biosynthesis protein [Peribacillus sp. NPDC094092]|uniref:PhzF family phenazine biosynthesis protein n=1 Tax=Peribacillus sp. NPDC094092 TaxID=3390611 RepID=UPI003D05C921
MELTIINTFTDQPFKGNPAAVCFLTGGSDSEWMQRMAKEINMPVTAFIHLHKAEWHLRWFTPSIEIPICGHGTLASAFFLWGKGYVPKGSADSLSDEKRASHCKIRSWNGAIGVPIINRAGDCCP